MRVDKKTGWNVWEKVQTALPVLYFAVVIFLLTFDDGWVLDHVGWRLVTALVVVALLPMLGTVMSSRGTEDLSPRQSGAYRPPSKS